ncbi:MAG TPA: cysteine desulfurase [Proteobacteria bacterium]|nr:cysteine desulfurase [bacterium BMS3Abin14]HDL52662.1 cysteine desulfurase [Pseudomonadota bacterium]
MQRTYLDHNATTPLRTDVRERMLPFFGELFGNPSSAHSFGQEVKVHLDEARNRIADQLGASPNEIVFTSGGTESDNAALKGVAFAAQKGHIVTTVIEHPAVIQSASYLAKKGFDVTYVPVASNGVIDPVEIKKALRSDTILVSVMHVNNEVGTIQPVREISAITRDAGVFFHTDAVQSFGKLPTNVDDLGVDLLSLAAHKIYGPKGVGALYIRKGTRIDPLIIGGAQEKRRRSGTENVAGVVGLGEAIFLAETEREDVFRRLTTFRKRLVDALPEMMDDVVINGSPDNTFPSTISLSVARVEGESMLLSLDMEGVAVSTGSACSSGSLEPSHVLMAMGIDTVLAQGTLRISMGRGTTRDEIELFLDVFPPIVARLRAMSPLGAKWGEQYSQAK